MCSGLGAGTGCVYGNGFRTGVLSVDIDDDGIGPGAGPIDVNWRGLLGGAIWFGMMLRGLLGAVRLLVFGCCC